MSYQSCKRGCNSSSSGACSTSSRQEHCHLDRVSQPGRLGSLHSAVLPTACSRWSSAFRTKAQAGERISKNWSLAPAPSAMDRVAVFDNLQGDDFRHPLDQQNTTMLRAVPGLEMISKTVMGPVAEQVLLLENVSTSLQIGPDQLPRIHNLLLEAAQVLGMEAPELYVRQNPVPNAYTLAITGHKPFIVVHTALLELLTPRELQAVLAHELGHLKCDHGLWLTVANVLASGTVTLLPIISGVVEESLLRWLRAAELTCDRAALLVAQDAKVVVSALMKLAGGSPSFAHELNVDAFLQQARSYEEATSSALGWYLRNAQTRALSHPLPVMRAREIDRWAQSAQYKALLTKNRMFRVVSGAAVGGTPGGAESAGGSGGAPLLRGTGSTGGVVGSSRGGLGRPLSTWHGLTAPQWGQSGKTQY